MPATLDGQPPSVLLAHKALEIDGPLTPSEISEWTGLKQRTTRYALSRLRESGLVEVERVMGDARRKRYSLADGDRDTLSDR